MIENNSQKPSVFHRFVAKTTKGDESKELFLWDICYRYEAYIAMLFPILCTTIVALIHKEFISVVGPLIIIICALAGITTAPLYEKTGEGLLGYSKREDIGQFRFALSNILGFLSTLLLLAFPAYAWYNTHDHMIVMSIAAILCYGVIFAIWLFAKDYVKWRFDWAIKNYELLWSRHYKWWTSALDYEVQKQNFKYFRAYKTHTALMLIAGPLCVLILILPVYFGLPDSSTKGTQTSSADNIEQTDTTSKSHVDNTNKPQSFADLREQSLDEIATNSDDETVIEGDFEEEGDPPAELDLPAYAVFGSWTIHGTIGSYRVNGTVTFTQDGFHGQYGYNGKKTGIALRGNSVDENDGHLFAQEFNNKGEQCGEYHGIFIYPRTCKGVFTNYEGEAFDFEWHFE